MMIGDEEVPIDGLSCQTVITKCLGSGDAWVDALKESATAGFNSVHFTPVQRLGLSGSSYSLYHQHQLTDQLLLKTSPEEQQLGEQEREQRKEERLRSIVRELEREHGLLSFSDVVWNHTAVNSPWLREHPEAGYAVENCPHLVSAYELDVALREFSLKLAARDEMISTEDDVDRIMGAIRRDVLPALRLWEYYVIDVDAAVAKFRKLISGVSISKQSKTEPPLETLHTHQPFSSTICDECTYRVGEGRFALRVRLSCAYAIYSPSSSTTPLRGSHDHRSLTLSTTAAMAAEGLSKDEIKTRCALYRRALERYNLPLYMAYEKDVKHILHNLKNTIHYLHVAPHGPRREEITEALPLLDPYFTEIETVSGDNGSPPRRVALANSGWIWNADPRVDFASRNSRAYYLRDLIVWSDSVKLRYGSCVDDNPWLWEFMRSYTVKMASIFHGVRLDNCHTTPLEVSQYLLDAARNANPNLFVLAELFTSSASLDALYCAALGINCLVREAMQATTVPALCGTVYASGGVPVASFQPCCASNSHEMGLSGRVLHNAQQNMPPAMCYDCTHDNEVPAQRRTAADTLPNTAIVSMAAAPIGSVRTYDLITPERISVVDENRTYAVLGNEAFDDAGGLGIYAARRALNRLHLEMAKRRMIERHVDHVEGNVVAVARHDPATQEGVFLAAIVAHAPEPTQSTISAALMTESMPELQPKKQAPSVKFSGAFLGSIMSAQLYVPEQHFRRDPDHINGLSSSLFIKHGSEALGSLFDVVDNCRIQFKQNIPGTVVLIRTQLPTSNQQSIDILNLMLHGVRKSELFDAVADLDLLRLNILLYRCDREERAASSTFHISSSSNRLLIARSLSVSCLSFVDGGVYVIPNLGPLPYCGLAGVEHFLAKIRATSDLGHPMCANLREGDWLMDYTVQRLYQCPGLVAIASWLAEAFSFVKSLHRHLVPLWFSRVVHHAYVATCQRAFACMTAFVRDSADGGLVKKLALGSVQMYGAVPDAAPRQILASSPASHSNTDATLAAGLPHFSEGYMRTWGRDTFIALRGLLLIPGRLSEALDQILVFASCMRHGLIPNLLGQGLNPRYNARDAVWWFLQSLQEYCAFAFGDACSREAVDFMQNTEVWPRFPLDQYPTASNANISTTLLDLVQEILQRHAAGISFREWNAGPQIDSKMQSDGFNVEVRLDLSTGFLYGGNVNNCGTWMDKMGESRQAGSFGIPATPRDGAAIEIVGLLKSALRWFSTLSQLDGFPYSGVMVEVTHNDSKTLEMLPYSEWNQLVQRSFESWFYVPVDPTLDSAHHIKRQYVFRRGLYKDSVNASQPWADYQLRPNQCVAMVVVRTQRTNSHPIHYRALSHSLTPHSLSVFRRHPSCSIESTHNKHSVRLPSIFCPMERASAFAHSIQETGTTARTTRRSKPATSSPPRASTITKAPYVHATQRSTRSPPL